MRVAIEGCAHGVLDEIYASLAETERETGKKIDLLISCGDFQAVRNTGDLECLSCPPKYRSMNSFYKYYSGEKVAPVLTLFIGGNHEAANHLRELYHGGWVAPNIYFLGYAGVVNINGVRIAGLSGIFNARHFFRGHYEKPPYSNDTVRSAYHIREFEVFKLLQITSPIDIFLSHDWPNEVVHHGDEQALFRRKPFFRDEAMRNELGSPPAWKLLTVLKPSLWFSAHLHVKYAAVVEHGEEHAEVRVEQTSDGSMSESREEGEKEKGGKGEKRAVTRFLALDKCLPRRHFLQVIEVGKECEEGAMPKLEYDAEWLAILKATHHLTPTSSAEVRMPHGGSGQRYDYTQSEEEVEEVRKAFSHDMTIPSNFTPTAIVQSSSNVRATVQMCTIGPEQNNQTLALAHRLSLPSILGVSIVESSSEGGNGGGGHGVGEQEERVADRNGGQTVASANEEEIDLDI